MRYAILIVDDEPTITQVLTDALSREPYVVLTASSAEGALHVLARNRIDVVISDEKMPGMSGSEFLAVVRKKYPHTIRMILTGHGDLESAMWAINEGEIYRFFTKPCSVLDLAMAIRKAIQRNELRKEIQHILRREKQQPVVIETLETQYRALPRLNGTLGET